MTEKDFIHDDDTLSFLNDEHKQINSFSDVEVELIVTYAKESFQHTDNG